MSSNHPSGHPLNPSTSADVPGHRICVVGTSGSGKTYVAEALARILDIPYVCNDAIIWRANWQETPRDEVLELVDAATSAPAWTYDGNLGPRPPDQLVLSRCDTLVWLDLPRWQVWSSIIRRTFIRAWTKEPFWHGNVERWSNVLSRDSMILWSVRTFSRRRRVYGAMFKALEHAGRVRIRLRSRNEVNRWLAALPGSKGWRGLTMLTPGLQSLSFLLLSVALLTACSDDSVRHIEANTALLAEFPVFSGATEMERRSSEYRRSEELLSSPDGYVTRVTYRVPPGTTAAEVQTFFIATVGESWRRGSEPVRVSFCRGDAVVAVETSSVEETGLPVYYLVADHQQRRFLPSRCPAR